MFKGQSGSGKIDSIDTMHLPSVLSKDTFEPQFGYPGRMSYQESGDSSDIRGYLEILHRRKWLILAIFSASIILTLVTNLMKKRQYRAYGKIELMMAAPRVTKFEGITMLGSQLQTRTLMQTQLEALQSTSLADRVIDKLHLEHNPAFNPAPRRHWRVTSFYSRLFGFAGSTRAAREPDSKMADMRLREAIEDKFSGDLKVQPIRDTMVFSLAFTSPDPSLSRRVVNTLIQQYMSWQLDQRINAAIAARRRLKTQIELARSQLVEAETKLNKFAREAGIVSLIPGLNLVYSQLEGANKAYSAVQTTCLDKDAAYKQSLQGGAIPEVEQNPVIQKLRAQYADAAAQYKELSVAFKEDYPKLQALKAKMQDLGQQIKVEQDRILDSMKNAYFTAKMNEESLKKDTEEKKALALALNDRLAQYKILERDVETSKQIHQSLLERYKEIDAEVGTALGNVRVLDYAGLPLSPCSPRMRRSIFIAAILGIIVGLAVAFFLEFLDDTVKTIEELPGRFQLPVLGVLPALKTHEVGEIGNIVRLNPAADFSEAVKIAKVSIQFSNPAERPPKLLFVTSTAARQGKSTFSVNLAQAFAAEERVLLIDADLRKPNLHRLLGSNGDTTTDSSIGLSNYLMGTHTRIVQQSGIANLRVVYAGPIAQSPSELLSSGRMRQFLDYVYKRYDRIIIDGPSVTGLADALSLGHYADGVVLVTVLARTGREAIRVFRRDLENVGGRLIGVTVNTLSQGSQFGKFLQRFQAIDLPFGLHSPEPPMQTEAQEQC